VQLLLIGLVLKTLFAQVNLLWVAALSIFMLLIAGREVMARQQRRFGGLWGYGLGTLSMFVSSFTLTVYALIVIVGTDPWYTPQYAIPLLGMMLGNTMTGVSLALDKLTTSAWQQRNVIEARLILGQDWQTAIGDIIRDSVRIGMIPMINAMAAAGIVSLPGMMTGQILSGTEPMEAVKYQILIMFLITAGTGFSAILATWIGARRLFDNRQRLRLERLS
jgi:putative ABC transport system permease protein